MHTVNEVNAFFFIRSSVGSRITVLIISQICKSVLSVKLKVCKHTHSAYFGFIFLLKINMAGILISDISPIDRSATSRKASIGTLTDSATART